MCVLPWVDTDARSHLWIPQIKMVKDNNTCKISCLSHVSGEDAKFINDRIREDYAINWLVDGLPAAEMKIDLKSNETFFDMGFNLGDNEGLRQNLPALNNHYEIVIKFVNVLSMVKRRKFMDMQISSTNTRYISRRWRTCMAYKVST